MIVGIISRVTLKALTYSSESSQAGTSPASIITGNMARLAVLVLGTMMVSLASGAALKHHSLTVYEKGVLFKQTMDIDVKNRVIYMHVPGHRKIPDCRYMYEYSTGRLLRCLPSIKQCYLSNFDTKSLPDPAEEEIDVKAFSRRHISPRKEARREQKINQDTVITEKINDLSVVSKLMRKAVGDYALYREEPLPKDAEILKGKLDPNEVKEKRQFINVVPCPGNVAPVVRYAYTTASCNRLMYCRNPSDRNSCREQHYTGRAFWRCGCCPHEWHPKNCRYQCKQL